MLLGFAVNFGAVLSSIVTTAVAVLVKLASSVTVNVTVCVDVVRSEQSKAVFDKAYVLIPQLSVDALSTSEVSKVAVPDVASKTKVFAFAFATGFV